MYPFHVTHVVLRRWRAGVRGSINPRIGRIPRRRISTHAWHQACDSTSDWEGHEKA